MLSAPSPDSALQARGSSPKPAYCFEELPSHLNRIKSFRSGPVLPCYTEYVKFYACSNFKRPWHMFSCILALQSREESSGFHYRKKNQEEKQLWLSRFCTKRLSSETVCSSLSQGAWDFPRKIPFFPWVVRVAGWGGCLVG